MGDGPSMSGMQLALQQQQQQQNQILGLLATALGDGAGASVPVDDATRAAALASLHRSILFPQSCLLVRRLWARLFQGLQQLLSDKNYGVRHQAAITFGSVCALAAPALPALMNGRPVPPVMGNPADRFMGWALPELTEASIRTDEGAVMALDGIREFLNAGEVAAVERFVPTVIGVCRVLLEDERTSMTVLQHILGLLTSISLRFRGYFQLQFVDMVDLLVGWALDPELSDTYRCAITDSLFQFKSLWATNLHFSLNLLRKFLDDMEILSQDVAFSIPQQKHRLLALASCFLAVLHASTLGAGEAGNIDILLQPLKEIQPRLLSCFASANKKFGDLTWTMQSAQIVVLLADILKGNFAEFYAIAMDIILEKVAPKSICATIGLMPGSNTPPLTSAQIQSLLKMNLKIIVSQGIFFLPSGCRKLLKIDCPFSKLRLHPNRAVANAVATTYLSLLRHPTGAVSLEASKCLRMELEHLSKFLFSAYREGNPYVQLSLEFNEVSQAHDLSQHEVIALFRFNIVSLLGSVCLRSNQCTMKVDGRADEHTSNGFHPQHFQAIELKDFLLEKLNPFEAPLKWYPDVQLALVHALRRLSCLIISTQACSLTNLSRDGSLSNEHRNSHSYHGTFLDCFNESIMVISQGLHTNSSQGIKLESLGWLMTLAQFMKSYSNNEWPTLNKEAKDNLITGMKLSRNIMSLLLACTSDREPRIRESVVNVLDALLQAEVFTASQLHAVTTVSFEQLGDSDPAVQASYRNLLLCFAIGSLWTQGRSRMDQTDVLADGDERPLCIDSKIKHWLQISISRPCTTHLRPHQVLCMFNYVSQRRQVLPSNWLQRLVYNSPGYFKSEALTAGDDGDNGKEDIMGLEIKMDIDTLESVYASNNLAAAWWLIQETARHCVTLRLRTHLGGPTQTFAALERMLLDIPQIVQTGSGQQEGIGLKGSLNSKLLPMRLLLELVEGLQKNIYNAYEGSTILPALALPSAVFFRANKKVCEEWFVRIREALVNASVAIHCHSATVHHAMLQLQDLRARVVRELPRAQASESGMSLRFKTRRDVLRVLRQASLALCKSYEADALLGLHAWASTAFSAVLEDGPLAQKAGSLFGPLGWMKGLVFQANKQFERAAGHFMQLLQSEEALNAMGADGVQFTIARIVECYAAIADWASLDSCLQDLQLLRTKHAGKPYAGALTTAGNDMNAIHALSRFDMGDVQGAWGYLDLTPQSSNELTADPRLALQRSEQMLLQAMLRKDEEKKDALRESTVAKTMLDEVLMMSALDDISEVAPYILQLSCIDVFEQSLCPSKESSDSKMRSNVVNVFPHVLGHALDAPYQDCQLWLKLQRVYRHIYPNSRSTLQLQQNLIRLARKSYNFKLARRLLNDMPIIEELKSKDSPTEWPSILSGVQYESILLLHSEGKEEESIIELWNLLRSSMFAYPEEHSSGEVSVLKARASMKFSSWLQQDGMPPSLLAKMCFDKKSKSDGHLNILNDASSANINSELSNTDSALVLDEAIAAGYKAATLLCPELSQAWFSFASWCYLQARSSLSKNAKISKPVIFDELLDVDFSTDGFALSDNEVARMYQLIDDAVGTLTEGYDSEKAKFKDDLVKRLVHLLRAAAGLVGIEDWDIESPSMVLSSQLQQELHLLDPSSRNCLIQELMQLWRMLRRRRVSWFGRAAHGFLKYLSLSNRKLPLKTTCKSLFDTTKPSSRESVLSATLYVLQIIQNYGVELADVLYDGLSAVPPSPWQEITPQLFARLSSHPEPSVRKQVQGLLMSLANVSPWTIVYPTLVDLYANEGQPSEELNNILNCLMKLHPKLVNDVRLMINELGSITVLWEEQWLSTLQDLHADVTRRINTLTDEAARVAENTTLNHAEKQRINAAKYTAMMAPVVIALERRLLATSRPPETPHEEWFQETYGGQLKSAISNFKAPPTGNITVNDVWGPFDAIASSLANHHKRSSALLSDVAPRLAILKCSDAPMPGLEVQTNVSYGSSAHVSGACTGVNSGVNIAGVVTVAAFDEHISILATKTKPKKISFVGSDGRHYTYLLKGREDLRLDARIMQLLRAVNSMLHASTKTRHRGLGVRYYSVTPLSGRAGLIQWVENVTSIYSVFKAWQQRAQAAQLSSNTPPGNNTVPPPVPRPSDMFYGKIIPALKELGLRKIISRRDWPQEVKRKVLLDLMKDTPRQLLYRELWCASEGLKAFNMKVKRFSGSVGVMSIVGHILGLGDRHLDNILLDFHTGDVVHIDYNVCFDKGLRLKIPEIVPFRLTQTIQAALGPTGTEGMFRKDCEAVLEALQCSKDVILMLLEVFIWDPLVEWMKGDGLDEATIGGEERKGMELAVSLSLFASHVQENRVALQEHHDQLLSNLPAVLSTLQNFKEAYENFEKVSSLAFLADQKMAAAAKAESNARAVMSEASSSLENVRMSYELQARDYSQAKGVVAEAARETTRWVENHTRVLDALRNGSIPEGHASGQLAGSPEAVSLISAVLAAGVPLTIVPEPTQMHCREVDREISQLSTARHESAVLAVKVLQAYSLALQRLLPPNYVTTSYVHGWAQVLQLCVRQHSPDAFTAAKRQAVELLSRVCGDHDEVILREHESLRLHIERLLKDFKKLQDDSRELEGSIDPDAEKKSKDRLMAIFTRHLQSMGFPKKDDDSSAGSKLDEKDAASFDADEKRTKVITVLQSAAAAIYTEIGDKLMALRCAAIDKPLFGGGDDVNFQNQKWCFQELQELIERCALVSGILSEVQQLFSQGPSQQVVDYWDSSLQGIHKWITSCQTCVSGVKSLITQLVTVVLIETTKAAFSRDPAVMEAFASLSQIRGTIDTALEQVLEIQKQKSALLELEETYYEKVGDISRRQSLLGEAAAGGRDHLSWEEAEELATQEELCREQLETLHRAWSQRSAQASALIRKEGSIKATLAAAEQRFESLICLDRDDLHLVRGKVILAAFAKVFSAMETLDHSLFSLGSGSAEVNQLPLQLDSLAAGFPGLEYIWQASHILQDKTFFVWKVGIMDILLDSCVRDASSIDCSISLEQSSSNQKKRFEGQLQTLLDLYLRERLTPQFLELITRETLLLKPSSASEVKEDAQQLKKEGERIRRAIRLLHEYSDVHETVRAARTAASTMKQQADEVMQSLQATQMEVARLEWLHDSILLRLESEGLLLGMPNGLAGNKAGLSLAWWNRKLLLENLQSAVKSIRRATEGLQGLDVASMSAEEQLDRAMAWACAGSITSASGTGQSNRSIGIPSEFHEHLRRRQQLLWAAKEEVNNIVRLCVAILEFEASREGVLDTETNSVEQNAWQQGYQNIIARLEATCLSFTSSELEWKSAQKSLEVTSTNLSKATEELRLASLEADFAAGELQVASSELRRQMIEATNSVATFCKMMRTHFALTSENILMLEEVLAITDSSESANNVHMLAKEAITERKRLVADISKAHAAILPLEPMLNSAKGIVASHEDQSDRATDAFKLGHSQALLQSLHMKVKDMIPILAALAPGIMALVEQLHSSLTQLARIASLDAGVLHKAFEGASESQVARSQSGVIAPGTDKRVVSSHEQSSSFFQPTARPFADDEVCFEDENDSWVSPPNSEDMNCYGFYSDASTPASPNSTRELLLSYEDPERHIVDSLQKFEDWAFDGTSSLEAHSQVSATSYEKQVPEIAQAAGVIDKQEFESSQANEKLQKPAETKGASTQNPYPFLVAENQLMSKERNAYAVSVLRRVRAKLEGRDDEGSRQAQQVSEQVDNLLRQATSIDNLCNMYEGWTPWI